MGDIDKSNKKDILYNMIRKIFLLILFLLIFISVFSQWTSPVDIWPYSMAYFQPNAAHSLVSDTLGNVHIAWYDASRDAYGCIKKTRFDGTDWIYTSSIFDDSSGGTGYYALSWMPTLSVEPDGKCLLVWEDYRTGSFELYGKYFDNTIWSSQITVTNTFESYTWFPKLYFADERHNLVFIDDSSGYFNVYFTYFDTMFQTKVDITDTNQNCISPDLFVYPDGEKSVLFTTEFNGSQALYNVRNSGAGWSDFIKVAELSSNIYYPNIISDGADEYAIFTSELSGVSDLFISQFSKTSWSGYTILSDTRSNIYNPAGVMQNGKVRIVYVSDENQYGNLYSILYNPSTKEIEEKTLLASHEHGYITLPQIVLDSRGDIHVVYIVNDDTPISPTQTNDIWWVRLPHTKIFSTSKEKPYIASMTYKGYIISFNDEESYNVTVMDKAGRKIFEKNDVVRQLIITNKELKRNDIYFMLIENKNSKYGEKIVWLR